MHLTFSYPQLRELLAAAEARWPLAVRPRYGIKDPPGFWLIGDEGVYLMHNGKATEGKQLVVYARECNPTTMPFEHWWAVKQFTFGGDDGCEFVDAAIIRDAVAAETPIIIEFAATTMSVFMQTLRRENDNDGSLSSPRL